MPNQRNSNTHRSKNQATDLSAYSAFLEDVKKRIRSAQYEALKVVNKELISLYWDLGKMIVDKQNNLGWGKAVVENMARDLQIEFPAISGFSVSNLWRMRLFYECYYANAKLAPLVREIGWTHNIVIMERCKDVLEREFYIRITQRIGWSKNVLMHQIDSRSYEKTLHS